MVVKGHLAAMGLLLLRVPTRLAWITTLRSSYRTGLGRSERGWGFTVGRSCGRAGGTLGTTLAVLSGSSESRSVTASTSGDEVQHADPARESGAFSSNVQPLLRKYLDSLEAGAKRRTLKARQHVNPLAGGFQNPVEMPEGWFQASFENPAAPLHVDIGCAKGVFVRSMAQAHPDLNFLGLEIRRPVAALGLSKLMALGLRNCHVVCCNVNVDLDSLLTEAREHGAPIDTISMQFPDPCFKAKQHKRRMLQPELVGCIQKHLRAGGKFFMQSDVLAVIEEMRSMTRQFGGLLEDTRPDLEDWMEGPESNPFSVPTEREIATYAKEPPEERRVYRAVFVKREELERPC